MASGIAQVQSGTILQKWSITEAIQGVPAAAGKTVTPDQYNSGQTVYTPTSTPPGKYHSPQTLALVAGAATIDLTNVPGLQQNIDGTGYKVNAFRIRGAATNGALTISPGAANPYPLFGAGNSVVYPAGCTKPWTLEFDDKLDDVAGAVKTIDLAGTGTDEFLIEILLG